MAYQDGFNSGTLSRKNCITISSGDEERGYFFLILVISRKKKQCFSLPFPEKYFWTHVFSVTISKVLSKLITSWDFKTVLKLVISHIEGLTPRVNQQLF